ncbi:YagK/YfjJ domain-containing protein [Oceanospirillum multiglobuliferum]|uniref:YagK/YfjJ C-terminal domain-containing protein n=1 Tax=Oceanospirillum multiglobuliferum TaxID=64969 RepID=A0A1V4T2G9_9GAMM|nr:inovirus-type Gp2 protein [Oceanospirillum multiglobuliferum]OPX54134.1 hypothetical protein BTE48_15715 [Oceanospirillum multiglobuliferum]
MKRSIESEFMLLGETAYRVKARKGWPLYPEIIDRGYEQISSMLSHHCRVLMFRLDIRLYDFESTNRLMTCLCKKLKQRLSVRKYHRLKRLGYLWAREQATSEAQHYHAIFLIDGTKIRHPANVIKLIQDICYRWDWPKPYTPKNCFYLLERNEPESLTMRLAVHRMSYLAKVNTKDKRPSTTHDYGTSRIKPRTDQKNNPMNTADQNTEVTS